VPSRYAHLGRAQLAVLVPELLLTGHLIDRAGMPYALEQWGEDGMTAVAIEEWRGASPVYTKRMQRALGFEGDDVATIFKGMQLEIGAPPQFMDFRYSVTDRHHGAFHLDHCGALLDVEPMGDSMVTHMCHDIEDPTFDATAVATNARARMRPLHRPPRMPADRHPHCSWTVEIDEDAEPVRPSAALAVVAATHAATLDLDPVDHGQDGLTDYAGELVADVDFGAFAHSTLVRLADEVALQQHLLNLSFGLAVRDRAGTDVATAERVLRNQLVGHAGLAATRLHRALGLGGSPEDAAYLLALHPVLNPQAYVDLRHDGALVTVRSSPAHADGGWLSLIGPGHPEALRAVVRAADPALDVEMTGTDTDWTARVVDTGVPATEAEPVQLAKLSRGATFEFQTRRPLPLTVL
jgi:hypothetical protein